ncbi:MAG TPA: hypothetical protein VKX28_28030 [Xanthobacteraceae bacterium]|nr:hypothetical protein [Xanthobacteraceae bacterium]
MLTKYLNMALILALVAVAGVVDHYTPSGPQRVAASVSVVDQLPN